MIDPTRAAPTPPRTAPSDARARLDAAARTAARLRARLACLLADGGRDAARLERLHQDLLQALAAARLLVELGERAGSPARPGADDALDRFERLARAWACLAVADGEASPAAGLRDLGELLSTEAAVCGVALRVREAAPATSPAVDLRAAARGAAAALRRAGPGGTLELGVTERGTITWDARPLAA